MSEAALNFIFKKNKEIIASLKLPCLESKFSDRPSPLPSLKQHFLSSLTI
jgi:hypothetical protein